MAAIQAGRPPLAAYNFRVEVGGVTMRFSRVTGLQREHQVVTYRHGLSFREGEDIVKFEVDRFVPVMLEQGTVPGAGFLHAWLESREPTAMEIQLCDADGRPAVAWRIRRALPVKLVAPAFDAASNDVAIDHLEIRAAGVSIVHLG